MVVLGITPTTNGQFLVSDPPFVALILYGRGSFRRDLRTPRKWVVEHRKAGFFGTGHGGILPEK